MAIGKSLSSYFFPRVAGQIEDQDGEEGDAHAGDDQVDGVEERLAPHGQDERDVRQHLVGILGAVPPVVFRLQLAVVFHVLRGRHVEDVPLDGQVKLGQVDADGHDVVARLLVHVLQVDLYSWKSRRSKLEKVEPLAELGT